LVVVEERLKTADPRSDEDTEARRLHLVGLERGVLHGHRRAGHRVLEEGIELAVVLLVDVLERVEPLELPRDAGVEARGVEAGDGPDTRAALHEGLPDLFAGVAHGGEGATPGDHGRAFVKGGGGEAPVYCSP